MWTPRFSDLVAILFNGHLPNSFPVIETLFIQFIHTQWILNNIYALSIFGFSMILHIDATHMDESVNAYSNRLYLLKLQVICALSSVD